MMTILKRLAFLSAPLVLLLSVRIGFSPNSTETGTAPTGQANASLGKYRLFSPEETYPASAYSPAESTADPGLQPPSYRTDPRGPLTLTPEDVNAFSSFKSPKYASPDNEKSTLLSPVKSEADNATRTEALALRRISTLPGSEWAVADSQKGMSLESLSNQSFDSYYAALFSNRSGNADTPAQSAQEANSLENPFSDAVKESNDSNASLPSGGDSQNSSSSGNSSSNDSRTGQSGNTGSNTEEHSGESTAPVSSGPSASNNRDVAPGNESSGSGSGSTPTESGSGGSPGSGSGSNAEAGSNTTPPPTQGFPDSSNDSGENTTPGTPPATDNSSANPPSIPLKDPGAFVFIGDVRWNGEAEIVPAIRFQDGHYEVPFLGSIRVKPFVIPDPYFTLKSVVIEDINNDTLPDILYVGSAEGSVSVMFGLPGGDFAAGPVLTIPGRIKSAAVFDFNSDRHKDLALIEDNGVNLSLFTGDGMGHFKYSVTWKMPFSVNMASIGNVNSDSIEDLFATNLAQNFRTWSLKGIVGGGLEPNPFTFSYTPATTKETDILFNGVTQSLVLFQWGKQMNLASSQGGTPLRHLAGTNLSLFRCFLILGDLRGKEHIDMGVGVLAP